MKKSSINPILVLIITLLTAVVFFSPHVSPQMAENKTIEDVISLEIKKLDLETRIASLEQRVAGLEKYNINSDAEAAEAAKAAKAERDANKPPKCKDCD